MANLSKFEEALKRFFKEEDILKIGKVKIGIAGAGGLGSNCAQALVRSGFKNFKIVDFDVINLSNLNRQFFFDSQIDVKKIEALAENLKNINSEIHIELFDLKISQENAKIFEDCDVIVEAFDNPECKKIIVEKYMNSGKLVVAASGVAGFGNSDEIKVHKIKENFYIVGDLVSEADTDCPPLAPKVQIVAAKQADVVLSYILERRKDL